jgi:transposase InsO family protein
VSPLLARYAAKAAEIGVGVSTLRRWVKDFEERGPAGLADDRWRRRRAPLGGADPRWLEMARRVLAEHTQASKPTRDLLLAEVAARLAAEHGNGAVPAPSPTRARILLREITRGASAFGGTKAKREIAGRPAAPYGRLRAVRPGEYLLLDTTRLDVFAMDPVTLRWVQAELTAAMDLYDRCITGLRLTPVSTKAVDAAAVLFESVRPLPRLAAGHDDGRPPYHGLPAGVVIDAGKLADDEGQLLLPSVAAETIVVDHGKVYLSEHLMSACARLGISVQSARVYQATDKGPLERWFRTLGEQLLAALPGYKGPDVYRRGKDPEQEAFYFLSELEAIIRQWTADYHRRPHAGLCVPEVPGLRSSSAWPPSLPAGWPPSPPGSASTASWRRSRPRSASSPASSTSTAPRSTTPAAGGCAACPRPSSMSPPGAASAASSPAAPACPPPRCRSNTPGSA